MQGCVFKPCPIDRIQIEINHGRKAEGEIGAGNLRTISSPKFWMGFDCVVIYRRRVTRMHVRIDQARDEKSAATVYPPDMWTGSQISADFSDLAIPENNIRMRQRSDTFRRDQSHVFDYRALINNALRVRRGPSIQNDKCSQCPRYQSIAQKAS